MASATPLPVQPYQQPPPAPVDGGRATKLSVGITGFTALVVGGLGATTTMVFVAEKAGLCDEGDAMLDVDPKSRSGDSDGVTVQCVADTKGGPEVLRDVGAEALFIGWGVWTVVAFLVLFPPILLGIRAVLAQARPTPPGPSGHR